MSTPSTERQPQQARSRRTHARLLAATLRTLAEHGQEGTTIPRIARSAGVSPATVYRRFEDKQALLRAAFLHMLESSNQANRALLGARLARGTLEQAARDLIELMFRQYREQGQLVQAAEDFLAADDSEVFVAEALAITDDNLDQLVEGMLAHRDEITHPDPERAVRIATMTAATAISVRATKPRSIWRALAPTTDEALAEELTRAYVAYLTCAA